MINIQDELEELMLRLMQLKTVTGLDMFTYSYHENITLSAVQQLC